MLKFLVSIFFLISLLPAAFAETHGNTPVGEITNYGIVEVNVEPQRVIKDKASPSGETRKYKYRSMQFVEKTTRIPAKKGIRFGLSYQFRYLGDMKKFPFQWKITHPVMKRPDGTTSTLQTYNRKLPVKKNGIARGGNTYQLKYDYEILPGEWIFEYFHEGKLLISKKFIVFE